MHDLILIGGPTACGKSRLAMELASHYGTCVISADSRQVYRGMDIGTAKPARDERQHVVHHLIDFLDPDEEYNAGQFERDVLGLAERLLPSQKPLVVAGGTGLYLRTLWRGIDTFPEVPPLKKEEIIAFHEREGLPALQERLRRVDPEYAGQVDLHNPHRLIRAIAVSESAGVPYSTLRQGRRQERPFRMLPILLEMEREALYRAIDARVDEMMAKGLLEEARRLWPKRSLPSLHTVGYQELFLHLDGVLSLTEAVELIKRNTRRYAKRQLTWFRAEDWWLRLPAEPRATLKERAITLIEANP